MTFIADCRALSRLIYAVSLGHVDLVTPRAHADRIRGYLSLI